VLRPLHKAEDRHRPVAVVVAGAAVEPRRRSHLLVPFLVSRTDSLT
jgi:hypothetical protein